MKRVVALVMLLLMSACAGSQRAMPKFAPPLDRPQASPQATRTSVPQPTSTSTRAPLALLDPHLLHLPLVMRGGASSVGPALGQPAAEKVNAPTAAPSPTPWPTVDPSLCRNLVYRQGEQLMLNGEPFVFVGFNAVDLTNTNIPDGSLVAEMNGLANMGATMIRIFCKPEGSLERLERILDLAGERGMRVVVTLQDYYHWKDANWFRQTYKEVDLPHITEVVTRFRDRPEIAIWEVMNEPWCGAPDEADDSSCYKALQAWAEDTTGLIRSLDPCRPISLGLTNVRHLSRERKAYKRLHELATVDIVSVHRNTADWYKKGDELEIAQELGKPVLLGEVYEKAYTKEGNLLYSKVRGKRAIKLRTDMKKALELGVDGYLIWKYTPQGVRTGEHDYVYFNDEFTFFADDPVGEIMSDLSVPRLPVPR